MAGNQDLLQKLMLLRPGAYSDGGDPADVIARGVQGVMPSGPNPNAPPTDMGNLDDRLQNAIFSQTQQGQRLLEQQAGRAANLGDEQQQLRAKQAILARHIAPNFGMVKPGEQNPSWTEMRPITGQGFKRGALNLLGDIGRAGLAASAATGPGQAIEGALYAPQREAYADTVRRIRESQEQQQVEQRGEEPAAQETYHPLYAGAKALGTEEKLQEFRIANETKIKLFVQNQVRQFETDMSRINAMKDVAAQRNATMELVANIHAEAMKNVAGLGLTGVEARVEAQREVANTLAGSRFATTNPVLSGVLNLFGYTESPGAPEVQPVGGAPSRTPTPANGSGRGGPAPGTVRLQAPNGQISDVPAAQAGHYIQRGAKVVQ